MEIEKQPKLTGRPGQDPSGDPHDDETDLDPIGGDELVRLYDEHSPRLAAFLASRVPRGGLEDAIQEVWLRVLRAAHRFQAGNFRAWLFQIARNYIIDDVYRKKPTVMLANEGKLVDHRQLPPDEAFLDQERREVLERCLQRLLPLARDLVKGRLSGESYEELCPALDLTPARAHKLFHAAKDDLQKCVQRT